MLTHEHSAERRVDYLVGSVQQAQIESHPVPHIEMASVFPDAVYFEMPGAMPRTQSYGPMSGRSYDTRPDGAPTRVKLDLLPEAVWRIRATRSCDGHQLALGGFD